jgi:WD40 repeat protein
VIANDFGFMQTLMCHSSSVRSLATHAKGDVLMSGSIDMTNKLYLLDNMTGRYEFIREMKYHDGFVLSIVPL